jgi:N-acetylneuraminic acid mutarotase
VTIRGGRNVNAVTPARAMHRVVILAVALLAIACSSHSVAPIPINVIGSTSWVQQHRAQVRPQSIGRWIIKASMPSARTELAAGTVNGILYAIGGGAENEAYDPETNTWTTKAAMPMALCCLGAGVVNGKLYAVGGIDSNQKSMNTLEAYDPTTDTWISMAPMPTARDCVAVGVIHGILYAVAGEFDNGSRVRFLNTVEAYNPATNTWKTKASIPRKRRCSAAGVINGILYIVGGYDGHAMRTLDAYNPTTDSWTTKASMPAERSQLASGVINGRLYEVGGASRQHIFNTVNAYDPVTNTWTADTPMPTALWGLAAGVINGTLYTVGGSDTVNGEAVSTVMAFSL